jgi:MATE family multidrug resistance protein
MLYGGRTMKNWWMRPAGGREVARVAIPLMLTSVAWTIHTFVDRIILSWHSTEALTAVFLSSTIWFTVLALPLGTCAYTSTFVAQNVF